MKIYRYIMVFAAAALLFGACTDWLDVKPKTQVDADRLYERESGFKQVLTGAYSNMCGTSMYGCHMTLGMVDLLGGVYSSTSSNSTYSAVRNYSYNNASVETIINSVWSSGYNTVSNLNHMIGYMRRADRDIFSEDNYNVILGEALGLRAFIHFDLLRLFAPSYKADRNAVAVPYVTKYQYNATPHYTVSAVTDSILVDLTEAAALLKTSDPMVTGREITTMDDEGYLLNREFRLNYYAVRAVMARVYMWKGDAANAAACAREVIESELFDWITFDAVGTPTAEERDRTFSPEHIFALQNVGLEAIADLNLKRPGFNTTSVSTLLFTPASRDALFPYGDDWRLRYLWELEAAGNMEYSNTKLWQYETMPGDYMYRQPLIRLPEMYLILAETMIDTDTDGAAGLVSEMMRNRGISTGVPAGSTPEAVRAALELEYRREFISEGVIFHYFKRLDADAIAGASTGAFTKEKYVLPIPMAEIEYGKRD